jgi:hypothetical protein
MASYLGNYAIFYSLSYSPGIAMTFFESWKYYQKEIRQCEAVENTLTLETRHQS